jgi:multidrug resistance efflux pump
MEAILLGIYGFFVWLIFIKLKWLPWNIKSQVIVVIIPIVGLTVLVLLLNIFAPSSSDVRVFKYTVPIVSQVRGRVIEVPVTEGNRPVKKGDVLFRIDPTPYQLTVNQLQAQLANAEAQQRQLDESLNVSKAKVVEATKGIDQANAKIGEVQAKMQLATLRVRQNRELATTGAGSKFELESSEADVRQLEAQLASARGGEAQARASLVQARASEQEVRQKMSANVEGEFAAVATVRAQLDNARWELEQTAVRSPCDCYVINLQLRPGAFVAGLPLNAVMSLVEVDGQVVALFHQNELHQVQPGDEAEFSLKTNPGKIIKAKVDSVIWATGAGQMPASGTVPMTGVLGAPPNRFAVKFDVAERDRPLFLAPGAAGDAAIYTQHLAAIHIIRKVILRVGAKLNYIVPKLH